MTILRRRAGALREAFLVLASLCVLLPACVELRGQRIAMHYDPNADQLTLLLFYDGVHDARQEEESFQVLRDFVANGDLMLFEWYGHVAVQRLREKLEGGALRPRAEAFLAFLLPRLETRALGHYRDPEGRIGALQLVRVHELSQVLAHANAAISESVLATVDDEDERLPYLRRLRAWAREEVEWLRLDGAAIALRLPVGAREWRSAIRTILEEFEEECRGVDEEERAAAEGVPFGTQYLPDRNLDDVEAFQGIASSLPLSIERRAEEVELRLGFPDAPSHFGTTLRNGYDPFLEVELCHLVPRDLDVTLAEHWLDGKDLPPDLALHTGLDLGLLAPEEPVRVMIRAMLSDVPGRREAALAWLEQWAERWRAGGGFPEPPPPTEDAAAALAAWKQFHDQLR